MKEFTEKDARKVMPILTQIGKQPNKPPVHSLGGRPKTGETLSDVLIQELRPDIRRKLAKALIDKALEGDLYAIKEVWDRAEGKARQKLESKRAEDDPLMRLLAQVMEQPKQLPSSPYLNVIEAEVTEITDATEIR